MERGSRTQEVMSYEGGDRAFILRFINAGTRQRKAGTRGGRLSGNRGRIAARNFFPSSSHSAMRKASEELQQLINESQTGTQTSTNSETAETAASPDADSAS